MADTMTPDILKIAEAFASKESSTAEDVIALVRGLKQIEDGRSAPLSSSTAIPVAATEQPTQTHDQPPAPLDAETPATAKPALSTPEIKETAPVEAQDPLTAASTATPPPSKPRKKAADKPKPAVSYDKAVTPDQVFCLECGRGMKMMKRHLKETHGMTPDDYRKRWQLPDDWPITAPNYAASKSKHAKTMGLGVPGKAAPAHSNRGRDDDEPQPQEINVEG
ncbi:MucR family transcriptional regulator [Roseivivax marinus]|uniref:MucR family transcriptional regulator n=1 Tax=Roseivivax marinus TaxID=1379903 RepID=UPI0027400218|nr:MucR family transcriptional regulator [Roseivivax marinus]